MPKVIYRADNSSRGFITSMLAPVNDRHQPRFGVRHTMWTVALAFLIVALLRLLLAN